MKAAIRSKYGGTDNVGYQDVETPVITEDKVLVKIHAASINKMDIHILQGKPFLFRLLIGLFRPKNKFLGSDISGVITSLGNEVTKFSLGDEVFGQLPLNDIGGYAEYVSISPNQLTHKPANCIHSETASVPIAGISALQALREVGVKEGTHVLIYGASGGVGTFAIQIAKHLKAHVTAVCSTRNVELARKSNADVVIDYKKEKWYLRNKKYNVIVGVNGYNSLKKYRDALSDSGKFIMIGGTMRQMFEMYFVKPFIIKKGKRFYGFLAKGSTSDFEYLANLLKNRELNPHIDKEFSLIDIKQALHHFMSGETIGKTIIKITD